MLLVYTHNLTSRVKYVFKQIFNQILGVKIEFTEDKQLFLNADQAKISYTHAPLDTELFFESHSILFETGMIERKINVFSYDKTSCFFSVKNSTLPFDPFAASFFMLSRYEEYLPHIKDKFGRFEAKESFAFKNNFLHKPVVDLWSNMIKEKIIEKYPVFTFPIKRFKYINTIDVDNAFLYLEKGFVRALGASIRDMFFGNISRQIERLKVYMGMEKDPYDTFDDILKLTKEYKLKTIFFFLLSDYGIYDRGISFSSKKLQSQIKSISDSCMVGIHPSFYSLSHESLVLKELNRLKNILHKDIIHSRQHFIRLDMPKMYRNLLKTTIRDDYSMGFASNPGFRSGTSNNYYFYDLEIEKQTDLKIHPFMIMDVTLKKYLRLNPRQSISVIKKIIDEVKNVNGTFISIWHNESFSFEKNWFGWDAVFKDMAQYNFKLENE